jgi:magnesium transporter
VAEAAQVSVRWLSDGQLRSGDLADLDTARATPLTWVDVLGVEQHSLEDLASRFDLHPLAVEDAMHFPQRPKLDQYGSTWFLVWLTPVREDSEGLRLTEMDVFLGPGFIITVHQERLSAIEQTIAEGPSVISRGAAALFHEIVDRLVDSVLPLVDDLADRLEDIEDVMLGSPRTDDLEGLYRLRRELVRLHRMIGPERDVLRSFVRVRDLVDDNAYRYLQDVGDHLARVEDSIETARDVAAAIMDIYLSAVSNRMNQIMKQLTVVATIFMPLTLLSGIYGMNLLKGMWPPDGALWAFPAVVTSMLVIAVGMALYFRRKQWW